MNKPKAQAVIIDDNVLNSEILATLLENSGLEAIYIASPREIMPTLATLGNLRVIFLDLEMPNYNGYDILQVFRGEPALNDVPIIAYTVHTNQVESIRQAGFDGFLGKPLIPAQFPSQIERILTGKAVWEFGG